MRRLSLGRTTDVGLEQARERANELTSAGRGGRDLMILDEPSSGLDAEAESAIHASLTAQRRGHATVLISHRLNTVRDADHIVVLSDGVIAEQGDHQTLMSAPGTYARLFSLQARGYAAEPVAAGEVH